jgi:Ala-tRNA(Pro) deacylase
MTCRERLEKYLRAHGVQFSAYQHPTAYTSQAVAEREHIPHHLMAKVVIVVADYDLAMLVLPASARLDLARVSTLFDARELRLANESEMATAFPDCEIGAAPPFGNLYDMPIYVDQTLLEDPVLYFQAGEHTTAMRIAYSDYARLVRPMIAAFTTQHRRAASEAHTNMREVGGW